MNVALIVNETAQRPNRSYMNLTIKNYKKHRDFVPQYIKDTIIFDVMQKYIFHYQNSLAFLSNLPFVLEKSP